MTEAEAIEYVTLQAQTGELPCIDVADVEKIVQRNKRASVWQASTVYNIGDRVQPTVRNGHFYECVKSGTYAATEPGWSTKCEMYVSESDSELTWQECAMDIDGNLFNLRNAVHEAWMLKASMAANQFDVSVDQQKWTRSQIYEHCVSMAEKFQPYD